MEMQIVEMAVMINLDLILRAQETDDSALREHLQATIAGNLENVEEMGDDYVDAYHLGLSNQLVANS